MVLLIDSNIILDFILSREPFDESAAKVLELGLRDDVEEYISAASVTDIHYIANRRTLKNRDLVNALITGVLNSENIAGVSDREIRNALNFCIGKILKTPYNIPLPNSIIWTLLLPAI